MSDSDSSSKGIKNKKQKKVKRNYIPVSEDEDQGKNNENSIKKIEVDKSDNKLNPNKEEEIIDLCENTKENIKSNEIKEENKKIEKSPEKEAGKNTKLDKGYNSYDEDVFEKIKTKERNATEEKQQYELKKNLLAQESQTNNNKFFNNNPSKSKDVFNDNSYFKFQKAENRYYIKTLIDKSGFCNFN